MTSVQDVSSLPVARGLVTTLQQKGFHLVTDLEGMKPLDLSDELGVSLQEAMQILTAVGPNKAAVHGVSAKDLFMDPSVGTEVTNNTASVFTH